MIKKIIKIFILIVVCLIVGVFILGSCINMMADNQDDASRQEDAYQEDAYQEEITSGIAQVEHSEIVWNSEKLELYSEFFKQPTEFASYEDYYATMGYMMIHNIDEYGLLILNPGYTEDDIANELNTMCEANSDLSLSISAYSDVWDKLNIETSYSTDQYGYVTEIIYWIYLSNNQGYTSQEATERTVQANLACCEIIDEMYASGELSQSMTDKEKAYAIYQWMVENVKYDYDSANLASGEVGANGEVRAQDFYSAIVEKSAVCQGISSGYIHLCRMAGIQMDVQYGYAEGEAHSWCKYQLEDGSYVYIDPTYAIGDYETNKTTASYWFWVTQEFLESSSKTDREFVRLVS